MPMLPVVAGKQETLRQIVIYSAVWSYRCDPISGGSDQHFYGVAAVLGCAFFTCNPALHGYRKTSWELFKFPFLFGGAVRVLDFGQAFHTAARASEIYRNSMMAEREPKTGRNADHAQAPESLGAWNDFWPCFAILFYHHL